MMFLWKYIIVTQQKLYLIACFLFKYSTFQSILPLNNFMVLQLLRVIINGKCKNAFDDLQKSITLNIFFSNSTCPVGWGCRIYRLLLCRGVRPPTNECPDMTLNNLMVRFQQCWTSGECGVPLYCHRSQVHSGPEW